MVSSVDSVDTLDKSDSHPGQRKQSAMEFHHATQNGEQFKTDDLFISRIFHLIVLGWSGVTKTVESETSAKGGLMNLDHDRWGGVSFRVSQDKLYARGQQEGKLTRA